MSLRPERRRRLLTDDAEIAGDSPPIRLAGGGSSDVGETAQAYSKAAHEARKRQVHTLFPFSRLAIVLYIGACLIAVGGCLGLHVTAASLAPLLGAEAVVALRLEAPASLGRWLASTLLGLTAATAVFIYTLRRHRLDDYHGRYRVWILAAAVCLTLSLAESTRLLELGRAVARLATEWGHLRFEIVWPAAIGLLGTALGIRLALEMRRCTAALMMLGIATLGFATAAAVYWQWPVAVEPSVAPLSSRGSWLIGYVFVLATFVVYGRQIQLDVAGATLSSAKNKREKPVAVPKEMAVKETAPRKPALKLRTDLDPVDVTPLEKEPIKPTETKPGPAINAISDSSSGPPKQRLSRAERRRMARETRKAS